MSFSRTRLALLAFGLIAAVGNPARSDQPVERVESPDNVRRFWQVAEVHAMAQDRLGFLWIGAEAGLVRFDGQGFVSISPPHFGPVVALQFDSLGRLWFATGRRGVFSLQDGRITEQPSLTAQTGVEVQDVRVDDQDAVWVRSTRGLFRLQGGAVRQFRAEDGLQGGPATATAIVQGKLWVATKQGLFAATSQGFARKSSDDNVTNFIADEQGRLWLASDDPTKRLRIRTGADLMVPNATVMERLPSSAVGIVAFAGGVVLATQSGAVWTDGDVVQTYRLPDVPIEANVWSLFVDRGQNLWMGTNFEGLLQIKSNPVTRTFSTHDLKRGPTAFAVAVDKRGGAWASSSYGVARLTGSQWDEFDVPRSFEVFTPRSLAFAPDGSLWISTQDTGVLRFADGVFSHLNKSNGLPTNEIFSLFYDRAGTLFMGITGGGLVIGRGGRYQLVEHSRQICPATAVSFAEGRQGEVWFATSGAGLCRFDKGKVRAFTTKDGLPEDDLRAVYADRQGTLWIGTNSAGVVLLRGETFERVPLDLGLNTEEVASFMEDEGGYMWLSTPMGLFRLTTDDVFAALAGKRKAVRSLRVGVQDGLRSGTFIGQWPASAARAPDGSLWFPNLRGLVKVPKPLSLATQTIPPPAIENLLINGTPVGNNAALAVGGGNVEVRFNAADLEFPARLQFWHRLKGEDRAVDTAWRPSGDQRIISYANLGAGRYEMQVAVRVPDRDDEQTASMRFTLTPPFYRTPAFFAAGILFVMLFLFGAYRLRMWQMRDRFAAVITDRGRIARDMHDTLEQGLIALKLQTESLLKNPADVSNVKSRAQRIQDLIGSSLRDAKSSVWALRADSAADTDLATALSVVAGWMLRGTEVKFELKRVGRLCRLEPEAQQQVVRIVQEALNNAVKHGTPNAIVLSLDFSPGDVRVSLTDDGRGFNRENPAGPDEGHFGLTGMRERAAQIGAAVHIDSQVGAGTRVTLVVPKRLRRAPVNTDSV